MNETISRLINHPKRNVFLAEATALVASCAGAYGLGFVLGKRSVSYGVYEVPKQLKMALDDVVVDEHRDLPEPVVLATPRLHLDQQSDLVVADVDGPTAKELLGSGDEGWFDPQAHDEEPDEAEDQELVRRSVFAGDDDDWNYETELAKRTEDEPFIIHKDEYFADETDYQQIVLTYYEGDNIMADESEVPVYDYERTTGPLNFGHGSGDPNVFYVRNDKRKAEYEILRNTGLFSVEVLGLEIEDNDRAIKHSDTRFRDTD